MKNQARNRILSFLVALALLVVPLSSGALAAEAQLVTDQEAAASQAEQTAGDVLPNLDNLEKAAVPPERVINRTVQLEEGPSGPIPVEFRSPLEAYDFLEEGRSAASNYALASASVGTTTRMNIPDVNGGRSYRTVDVVAAAVNDSCIVWVHKDTRNAPVSEFLPNGSTPSDKAQLIADEFDSNIYDLLADSGSVNFIATPYNIGNGKINIVLGALFEQDGLSGGTYVAGFFTAIDLTSQSGSNGDKIVYMDITNGAGYQSFTDTRSSWFGTLAHEFTHLLTGSAFVRNVMRNNFSIAPGDPETPAAGYAPNKTTWLEEGIAGMGDFIYNHTMSADHFRYFMDQNFASGIGYVPTSAQWNTASNTGGTVLSNYGASAALMIEFYSVAQQNLNDLAEDGRMGYIYSKDSVADHYWGSGQGTFDQFFEVAVLNMAVDTPNAPADSKNPTYQTLLASNLWASRMNGNSYRGVNKIAMGKTDVNMGNRQYFSQLYLSDAVGKDVNGLTITIPADAKASYYVITPDSATNIDDNAKWNNATKIAAKLKAGANEVRLGTNNRYAIVAVSYGTAVGTESIEVAASYSGIIEPGDLDISTEDGSSGDLMAGSSGKIKLNATTQALENDTVIEATVVKVSDESVASGYTRTAHTLANVDSNGKGTASFEIDFKDIKAGTYAVRLTAEGARSAFAEFIVYLNPELGNIGSEIDGDDIEGITTIRIDFGVPISAGSGSIIVTVGGETFRVEVKDDYIQGTSLVIPISDLRGSAGSFVWEYNSSYTVEIEEGAVVDEDGNPNKRMTVGTFDVNDEPGDPSVVPSSITIARGESARIGIFFGSGNIYDDATLTVDNSDVISLSDESVSRGGDNKVTVTAGLAGRATITIGFSGNSDDVDDYTKEVSVTVTGTNPSEPGGPGNAGGGGGGGSTSGGGRRGGGGGGGGGSRTDGAGTSTTVAATTRSVDRAWAVSQVNSAAQTAIAAGQTTATVRLTNYTDISLSTMQAMAAAAEQAGVTVTVQADTIVDGKVAARISFNPAKATKDIKISASVSNASATSVKNAFSKHFSNQLAIVAFDQADDFGMDVRVAARLDLAALGTTAPVIYSYNRTTNVYTYNAASNAGIDANGYLWYNTASAGHTIVSDKALTAK